MEILGIGPMELLLILIIAMMVFGPDKLPEMGAKLGQSLKAMRRATREFSREIEQTRQAVEAPVHELAQPFQEVKEPMEALRQDLASMAPLAQAVTNPQEALRQAVMPNVTASPESPEARTAVDAASAGGTEQSSPAGEEPVAAANDASEAIAEVGPGEASSVPVAETPESIAPVTDTTEEPAAQPQKAPRRKKAAARSAPEVGLDAVVAAAGLESGPAVAADMGDGPTTRRKKRSPQPAQAAGESAATEAEAAGAAPASEAPAPRARRRPARSSAEDVEPMAAPMGAEPGSTETAAITQTLRRRKAPVRAATVEAAATEAASTRALPAGVGDQAAERLATQTEPPAPGTAADHQTTALPSHLPGQEGEEAARQQPADISGPSQHAAPEE